jgi:heptosyltransferase I
VPGLQCDWLVEEAYREVPAWHPGVRRTIPCAVRRWRRRPLATLRDPEWAAFRAELGRERYDLVLDAQGLLKSALLSRLAHGPRAGRSFGSAREGLASLFYQRRIAVDLQLSEVEQLRQLFARALGYAPPEAPADFGLDRGRFAAAAGGAPYAVFVHAAAWPSKLWPLEHWQALGRAVRARGLGVKLPWGTEPERAAAQRIAAACGGEVLPRGPIAQLAPELAGARCVVGLDTGLTHLAVALGVPTVALYGPSVPVLERVARGELVNLASVTSRVVDTSRPNTVPLEKVLEAASRWW